MYVRIYIYIHIWDVDKAHQLCCVCAALHGQECTGNEYRVVGNFMGEQFLQISQITIHKNFSATYFTVVKHMVHSQCLPKSLPLQLLYN